jgi:LemA protein
LIGIVVIVLILGVWGCNAYNGIIKKQEGVEAALKNVNAEYQLRYDLVDNLVKTVKEAANFERETLEAVTTARSKASSVQLNMDNLTPEAMKQFEQAQGQLSGALSRLLVTIEKYPDLKAVAGFQKLQDQLEGIENDIRNARTAFNEAVRQYNVKVRSFPTNMFGFSKREGFVAEAGAEKAPKVDFNK